jgi:hypothetical protein
LKRQKNVKRRAGKKSMEKTLRGEMRAVKMPINSPESLSFTMTMIRAKRKESVKIMGTVRGMR